MPNFLGALNWDVGDIEVDDIGARRSRRGGRGGGHRGGRSAYGNRAMAARNRANRAAAFVMPDIPGTPTLDGAILPASWPIFAFAAADGTNIKSQTMNPQCAFRGQRLTAVVLRSGTSAAATAPLINQLQVGMKPIIVTGSAVALELYVANAFDTNLLLPPTTPGVNYLLNLQLAAALTSTDTVTVIAGVNGSAVL
jgi:hypothetical protein